MQDITNYTKRGEILGALHLYLTLCEKNLEKYKKLQVIEVGNAISYPRSEPMLFGGCPAFTVFLSIFEVLMCSVIKVGPIFKKT